MTHSSERRPKRAAPNWRYVEKSDEGAPRPVRAAGSSIVSCGLRALAAHYQLVHRITSSLEGNTMPGAVAPASRALAVVYAEQAASHQMPRIRTLVVQADLIIEALRVNVYLSS
jgi:hypothetical protein